MYLRIATELVKKYAECRGCGSTLVNNGEGELKIGDATIKRSCKCGWCITVTSKIEPLLLN